MWRVRTDPTAAAPDGVPGQEGPAASAAGPSWRSMVREYEAPGPAPRICSGSGGLIGGEPSASRNASEPCSWTYAAWVRWVPGRTRGFPVFSSS